MAVVSMMRISGDPDELAGKLEQIDSVARELARKHGGLANIVARTDDGILVVNLWENEQGRHDMAEEPQIREALQAAELPAPAFEGYEVISLNVFPEAVSA